MESEYWIDSVSLKGTHQVSSLGRVKRLSRRVNSSYGASRVISEKISTHRAADGGYKRINLCRDGKWVTYLHHRLVAEAFIPNPNGLPFINHKDGDKTNNHPDNLEWCTHKENMAHAMITGLNSCPKSVVAVRGFFGFWFPSQAIASRSLGVSKPCICAALRGNQKTAGGYSWEYAKLQREQNQ